MINLHNFYADSWLKNEAHESRSDEKSWLPGIEREGHPQSMRALHLIDNLLRLPGSDY